jgi:hypothetical protein
MEQLTITFSHCHARAVGLGAKELDLKTLPGSADQLEYTNGSKAARARYAKTSEG